MACSSDTVSAFELGIIFQYDFALVTIHLRVMAKLLFDGVAILMVMDVDSYSINCYRNMRHEADARR